MPPTFLQPDNPFIKVSPESVSINYNGQNHSMAIEDIENVYLKKTKMNYIPSFINTIVPLEKRYKLFIRTNDSKELKIKIKAAEKQHFINLVFHIRKEKANLNKSVA